MVVIERVAILMGSPHGGIRHIVVGYVTVVCKSVAKIKLSEPRTHNIDFWWVYHTNRMPAAPDTLIFAFYAETDPLIAASLNSSSFSI